MTAKTAQTTTPALTVRGTHATLTGVQFSWSLRCAACRKVTRATAEGGTMHVGLNVSVSKKTVRWHETSRPPARPPMPATCPECGDAARPFAFLCGDIERAPLPATNTLPVLNEAWAALRAAYPALAVKADAALARG